MAASLSAKQRAIRALFILVKGARPLPEPGISGEVSIFEGATRYNAIAFWMRNPDYLANELLDLYEEEPDERILATVARIFDDKEPELRLDEMIRWKYGAHEKEDDALSVLVARKLIRVGQRLVGGQNALVTYHLMQAAHDVAKRAVEDFPRLRWYWDRMDLVLSIAGDQRGSVLKQRQYMQFDYASTVHNTHIPTIAPRVLARLRELQGAAP